MKLKLTALTLVGLMAGAVFLTFTLHRWDREKVCSEFQEHQLVNAKNIAGEIKEFFHDHSMTLQTIRSSCRYEGMKRLRRDIDLYSESMKAKYIKEVSFYDQSGKTIYSTGSRPGLQAARYNELIDWTKKSGNQEKVFVFTLAMDRVVIAVPVYQERPENRISQHPGQKRFVGIFAITTDLRNFFLRELEAVGLQPHQAWIMNREGTLLYHYQHPEMVSRNLSKGDETCNRCHISNGTMEKILNEKEGKFEYEVKEGPKKLAAFSSAQFGKNSWTVVVNSEVDKITGFRNKDFHTQLALLGLAFLAALFGSFQLLRKERFKSKAEEDAKGWQERITEGQKVEDELKKSTERLHFLSTQLLNAQETERRRITNELHDELGQDLTVLKLLLGHILKKLPEDRKDLRELSMETLRCADHLMENVRRVFQDLSPHLLEHFGLTVALQRLIKDFGKMHEIGIEEEIINIDHLIPKEDHIIVYRILQELLTNIGKHAQATLISVVLKMNKDHFSLSVEDDGKGFDINRTVLRTAEGKGMGLAILDERVRMLGGLLDIQIEEGQGTRVNITIPIK